MNIKITQILDDHIWVMGIYSQLNGSLSEISYSLPLLLSIIMQLYTSVLFKPDRVKMGFEEVFEYLPLNY
jgi:hypothetical protein